MSFTPLTSSRSLVYTSPSSPYDDIQDLRVELTSNLETIEARMDRQWDMMMTQFRTQSDQMTSQFNHLAVQLGTEASAPRSLTPATTLQPPPGIDQQPETVVSEDSVHEPDNPSWLHGPPLVTQTQDSRSPSYLPPVVGSRSIRYAPVNITPGTAPVPPAASTLAPSTLPPHHHSSNRTPPRSLFSLGGSQSGRGNGDRVPAIPEQKATRTSVDPPNFGPKPDRNQTVTV
jgi:hypothetical protein